MPSVGRRRRHIGHAVAELRQQRERLHRRIETRRQAEKRTEPLDDAAGYGACIVGCRMIPAVLRQALRLVEEDEHQVFRLIGGGGGGESRGNIFFFFICGGGFFFGGGGLAPDINGGVVGVLGGGLGVWGGGVGEG